MSQSVRLPLGPSQRTALLLAASSAIAGSVGPITIGSGGLAGASLLSGDTMSLATMPVTTFVVGSAIAAIPAALLMRRVGRRAGFIVGALIGATGAGLASLALSLGSFWFFAFSMTVLGGAATVRLGCGDPQATTAPNTTNASERVFICPRPGEWSRIAPAMPSKVPEIPCDRR